MKALTYLIFILFIVTIIVTCSKTNCPDEVFDQPISVSVTIDSVGPTSTEVRVR